jgi:hypothetical protein
MTKPLTKPRLHHDMRRCYRKHRNGRCTGELACTRCRAHQDELPTECPGYRVVKAKLAAVRRGEIDFRERSWVELRRAPGACWTRARLLALPHEDLRRAAVSVGAEVDQDAPASVVIDAILARQGEMVGRSVRSVESRLMNLEEAVLAMEHHLVRLGRMVADISVVIEQGRPGALGATFMQDALIFYRLARSRGRY